MPRMANGDLLLLIRWPDPECAQRWPQSYPCSRAQIIRMLDAGEDIVVYGLQPFHTSGDSTPPSTDPDC